MHVKDLSVSISSSARWLNLCIKLSPVCLLVSLSSTLIEVVFLLRFENVTFLKCYTSVTDRITFGDCYV